MGTLPAWCLLGPAPAPGKESGSVREWGRGKKGVQTGQGCGEGWNHHRKLQGQRQGAAPLTQLTGAYQVVTQTRWMRPDAKRANKRQRRTGEARGDRRVEVSLGSHVKSGRNVNLREPA